MTRDEKHGVIGLIVVGAGALVSFFLFGVSCGEQRQKQQAGSGTTPIGDDERAGDYGRLLDQYISLQRHLEHVREKYKMYDPECEGIRCAELMRRCPATPPPKAP